MHHQVDGTTLHIIESLFVGHQYSSHYYLLRSVATIAKLADAEVQAAFNSRPWKFGKRLLFGPDLDRDSDGVVVYLGSVAPNKLVVASHHEPGRP